MQNHLEIEDVLLFITYRALDPKSRRKAYLLVDPMFIAGIIMRLCDTDHGSVLDDRGASYERDGPTSGISISASWSSSRRLHSQKFLYRKFLSSKHTIVFLWLFNRRSILVATMYHCRTPTFVQTCVSILCSTEVLFPQYRTLKCH